jgi:hypothetical protein
MPLDIEEKNNISKMVEVIISLRLLKVVTFCLNINSSLSLKNKIIVLFCDFSRLKRYVEQVNIGRYDYR